MYFILWKQLFDAERILHLMVTIQQKSICFYFMWKRTHFPLRDFIQQEV